MISVGIVFAAGTATAGAWTLAEDAGQLIGTTTRYVAPVDAMWGGVAERDSNASQLFVEYGLRDDVTAGLKLYSDYTATTNQLEARLGGHTRVRFWTGPSGDVASAQIGVSFPVDRWFGSALGTAPPDSVAEVDLRALYGRGWQHDWGDSFVSSEVGLRWRAEGLDEELILDVTAGFRPFERLLALIGLYSALPLGELGRERLKIAPSLAYTLASDIENDEEPGEPEAPTTIQFGIVWDSVNPGDGLGISLGIWQAF